MYLACENVRNHAQSVVPNNRVPHQMPPPHSTDEQQPNQVQVFEYDEDVHGLDHFEDSDAFIKFLGVTVERLPPTAPSTFTFKNFLDEANKTATSIKATRRCLFLAWNVFSNIRPASQISRPPHF